MQLLELLRKFHTWHISRTIIKDVKRGPQGWYDVMGSHAENGDERIGLE